MPAPTEFIVTSDYLTDEVKPLCFTTELPKGLTATSLGRDSAVQILLEDLPDIHCWCTPGFEDRTDVVFTAVDERWHHIDAWFSSVTWTGDPELDIKLWVGVLERRINAIRQLLERRAKRVAP